MSLPPPLPPPGQGATRQQATHPQGSNILALGILSLIVCPVLGPIPWTMAHAAIKEMDAQPNVEFTNRGIVTAGWICGIISSLIFIGALAVIVILGLGHAANELWN